MVGLGDTGSIAIRNNANVITKGHVILLSHFFRSPQAANCLLFFEIGITSLPRCSAMHWLSSVHKSSVKWLPGQKDAMLPSELQNGDEEDYLKFPLISNKSCIKELLLRVCYELFHMYAHILESIA